MSTDGMTRTQRRLYRKMMRQHVREVSAQEGRKISPQEVEWIVDVMEGKPLPDWMEALCREATINTLRNPEGLPQEAARDGQCADGFPRKLGNWKCIADLLSDEHHSNINDLRHSAPLGLTGG